MSDENVGTWSILMSDRPTQEVEVVKPGACYGVAGAGPRAELERELEEIRTALNRAAGVSAADGSADTDTLIDRIKARSVRSARAAAALAMDRLGGGDPRTRAAVLEALEDLEEAHR